MRHFKLYLSLLLLMAFGMVGCQDDFDSPPVIVPEAQNKPNTTILEIKNKFWQDTQNYIDTIRLKENGDHYIIKGRVISSDETGNIYKNLVIQDETAALAMSINANSLYTSYRVGQEIVIDLTDMYIGKYAALQQLGFPEYSTQYGWQTTFMPLEFFQLHAELNGLPNAAEIDTLTTTISSLPTLPADVIKWQSQLVRFDNVHFELGGKATFADPNGTTSRNLSDENGNTIIMRNSNYATFKNEILPAGTGNVVGILSYFNGTWQLLIRSTKDCIDFSSDKQGTKDNPYPVTKAIELQGKGASGWMTGYIVGAVAPKVTEVKSNDDIEWGAPTTLANTIVIGATPDTKDFKNAIVVPLPEGSELRAKANLVDNVSVYKKQIKITGTFASVLGTYGLTDNSGATQEFEIEGQSSGGNGSEESPFTVSEVLGGATGTEVWVKGYIVGWVEGQAYKEGAKFTVPATVASNILVAASKDVTDPNQCIPIQLVFGTEARTALNLVDHKENLGAQVSLKGNLEKYFGVPGVKTTSDYKLGDTPTPPEPPEPPVSTALRADFETLNGGVSSGFYITGTSTNGWTITGCSLLQGGDADANPAFKFIGKVPGTSSWAFAPCMNGKVGAVSSIVSPTITTGCGTLSFNYGMPFTESNGIDFRVDIKQNGSVVKTINVKKSDAEKATQYSFSETINIKGNFTIEFTPNSPSNNSTQNKDRACVYNVAWTEYK